MSTLTGSLPAHMPGRATGSQQRFAGASVFSEQVKHMYPGIKHEHPDVGDLNANLSVTYMVTDLDKIFQFREGTPQVWARSKFFQRRWQRVLPSSLSCLPGRVCKLCT